MPDTTSLGPTNARIISEVCADLSRNDRQRAIDRLLAHYPHVLPSPKEKSAAKASKAAEVCEDLSSNDRQQTIDQLMTESSLVSPSPIEQIGISLETKVRIFLHDGFIDRYFPEQRLVFPPVLRLISMELGEAFPYNSAWVKNPCHQAYVELFPVLDHVTPRFKGGSNDEQNLVTVSYVTNNEKSTFSLEELNWTLHPPGKLDEWDGCILWFMQYIKEHPDFKKLSPLRSWYVPAKKVLPEFGLG